jgi:uncharacterized repeat protein (TIGR01451 family)
LLFWKVGCSDFGYKYGIGRAENHAKNENCEIFFCTSKHFTVHTRQKTHTPKLKFNVMKKLFHFFAGLLFVLLISNNIRAQSIGTYTASYDSVCGETSITTNVTGCIAGLSLKTFFGDGTFSTNAITCFGTSGYLSQAHVYPVSGTYTIKMVLFSGTSPIDSITWSHTYHFCRNMPINAFVDMNGNCLHDAGDYWPYAASIVEIDSAGVHIDTVSMYSGLWYEATGMPGTIYRFRMLTPPSGLVLSCPSSGVIYDTIPWSPTVVIPAKSFAFTCAASTAFDLQIHANFRPALTGGGANKANITVHNTSCSGTAALVRFDFSPKYTFGSLIGSTAAYTVSGTSVTFDIGTVSAFASKSLYVALTPVVALTMGDTVNTKFTVTPTTGDGNTTNNVVIRCDTIRASFDPNHKSVTPTGNISAGTQLEYVLDFENLGNDTAYNVHIQDTLSNSLDINTFRAGVSTHSVNISKSAYMGSTVLKFDFPNIKLWDSSHHDKNKGMVTFYINAKTTLALGTVIPNRVGIYFDTNPVVMTNTVFSKIPLPTGINNTLIRAVEVYPNPVMNLLTISTDEKAYESATIYNMLGQTIMTHKINEPTSTMDVSNLTPGIYYVNLKGSNETRTIKIQKL